MIYRLPWEELIVPALIALAERLGWDRWGWLPQRVIEWRRREIVERINAHNR